MKLIIPVESMSQNKGGCILYDPDKNRILKQYVHDKKWLRVGWRGGIVYKNKYLIATDWNEVHCFNIKEWKYLGSFSKNTFNDLHYLYIFDNNLYVVNTGIDAIEKFSNPLNPIFEKLWFVFESNKKFKKRKINLKKNYNEFLKVKPHSCHPNCTFINKKLFLVTCFEDQTRAYRTGNVIDINSGKIIIENKNCHDGLLYKKNLYLSGTRENEVLIVNNFLKKKWPTRISDKIRLHRNGWWRGMVINDDIMYLFASYGYGKSGVSKVARIDLKSKDVKIRTLPIVDGYFWNTIYQPNIYSG